MALRDESPASRNAPPGWPEAALTFLPGDPPRRGTFFFYRPRGALAGEKLKESLEVVLPSATGGALRR